MATRVRDFRSDINGLRAVAVLAVLLYHFQVPGATGGFVGVDVFFVISGYLMTKIIDAGLERGTFSVWGFYLARATRIMPALLVICFMLLALGYFYLPPPEYKQLAKHAVASATFLSNIAYLREAGYFAASSHEKWLLHTWSLSVEWQFYLAYPLLLLAMHRLLPKEGLKRAVVVMLAASLAYCIYRTPRAPDASFFILTTRAWEMLLGALAYFFPLRIAAARGAVMEGVGLALIVFSTWAFDSTSPWPGWRALIPSVGAALLIAADRGNRTALRFAPVQFLGTVSYSVYLWHWPLVVGLVYASSLDDPLLKAGGLAASVSLGWLSYRWVEQVRTGQRPRMQHAALVAALASVLAVATLAYRLDGIDSRMPPPYRQIADEIKMPHRSSGWCFYSVDSEWSLDVGQGGLSCLLGDRKSDRRALLFGDSFAGHYEPFWDAVGKDLGLAVSVVSTNWCYPAFTDDFPSSKRMRSYQQCLLNRTFLQENLGNYDVVILAGYWRAVFSQHLEAGALAVIDRAAKQSKWVVVMAAPTDFDTPVSPRWRRTLLLGQNFDIGKIGKDRDELTARVNAQLQRLTANYPNVIFLDRAALFGGREVSAENIPFNLDGTHISIYGSKQAASIFMGSPEHQRLRNALSRKISRPPSRTVGWCERIPRARSLAPPSLPARA